MLNDASLTAITIREIAIIEAKLIGSIGVVMKFL